MISADKFVALLDSMRVTHVTGVPDSTFGPWFDALRESPTIRLVPVCREGEAWAVAGGLHLGGARPLVMMQCTGLFESGDSLRNAIHDFGLPLYALIGYRNYLRRERTVDTAMQYAEPVLKAWGLDYLLIETPEQFQSVPEHAARCEREGRAGVALIAEGQG
jgi:sulfopyruvate decarboxylase TPP-binding subunit